MNQIKMLFLAANPTSTHRLMLDEEIRAITQKIRASEHRDLLQVEAVWAVRPDDLLQALNEHKPQIVHFSGHGSASEAIILTDKNGRPQAVSTQAIKALFTALKDNIQVVILNACYSHAQAEAIVEVIDCAIGMNAAIGDQAATVFAASFYRALGFGRSVQEAFDQGKVALLLEGIAEENTPELLVRTGVDPLQKFLIKEARNKNVEIIQNAANNSTLLPSAIDDEASKLPRLVNIFFCYAHEDETLLNKLKTHLKPLQRRGIIDVWYDQDISAGTEWEHEIDAHLNQAQIILLLISPDFINSDYCYSIEMKRALERHERGEATVIPIFLRLVYWQDAPFAKLQALPRNMKPVTSPHWHNWDEALYEVAKEIREVVVKRPN